MIPNTSSSNLVDATRHGSSIAHTGDTQRDDSIVSHSPALREALERVDRVACVDTTVLITGETGTGKELMARTLHRRSQRAHKPLVAVNLAAIPEPLVASELFGHEQGAFTGAVQRRLGRFEIADRGTLFLDEVGELPADAQVALLRVIQEGEFERLGASQTRKVDVRLVVATNRNLEQAVDDHQFRADLYYRLSVFPIHLPPLRERREDIPRPRSSRRSSASTSISSAIDAEAVSCSKGSATHHGGCSHPHMRSRFSRRTGGDDEDRAAARMIRNGRVANRRECSCDIS